MTDTHRLDGGGQTLLVRITDGRPELAYWGPGLPFGGGLPSALLERAGAHGMLDGGEAFDLWPQSGHGFTGRPALEASRPAGAFISQMQVRQTVATDDALAISLVDAKAGLEGVLTISLDAATGVAGFRMRLTNAGDEPLRVDWLAPVALAPPGDELLTFGGSWSGEFREHRQRLSSGIWGSESRTGRTSHHAPPMLVAGSPGFGEDHGEVLALHFGWSGDHRLFAERLRDGRVQIQAGELPWPGEIALAPGEAVETPTLYAARSHAGLNGLSARWHPFVRKTVLGGRLAARPRPVHFNTWEAVYFRHDLAELKALADRAAAVGAERFVLDDGWFRGRDNDRAGLGDWTPDAAKYPHGLTPLIDHVRGLGLEFGLWVEPEMVNADSELLRAHPDWILGEPGRSQPLGRGQYVLDLTRDEVADNIYAQLDALLTDFPIAYLKWDMNRDLTHPMSRGRPAARAQVRAVYALIDRLRAVHPRVEIESCASGGGRADLEILRRTDRIWTSDCNDPFERQRMQRAAMLVFPPEVLGAHVGPEASHTTARSASLDFRAMTALFGHFGIEADVRAFPEDDVAALARAIALHKRLRALLHSGRVVRLPYADAGAVGLAVIGEGHAVASLGQVDTPPYPTPEPFRVTGLDPEATYAVTLLNPPARPRAAMKRVPALARGAVVRASGRMIAEVGLPLPILRAGEVAVYEIIRETTS
jgi:alpha-galactosidase